MAPPFWNPAQAAPAAPGMTHEEYQAWLRQHGGLPDLTQQSDPMEEFQNRQPGPHQAAPPDHGSPITAAMNAPFQGRIYNGPTQWTPEGEERWKRMRENEQAAIRMRGPILGIDMTPGYEKRTRQANEPAMQRGAEIFGRLQAQDMQNEGFLRSQEEQQRGEDERARLLRESQMEIEKMKIAAEERMQPRKFADALRLVIGEKNPSFDLLRRFGVSPTDGGKLDQGALNAVGTDKLQPIDEDPTATAKTIAAGGDVAKAIANLRGKNLPPETLRLVYQNLAQNDPQVLGKKLMEIASEAAQDALPLGRNAIVNHDFGGGYNLAGAGRSGPYTLTGPGLKSTYNPGNLNIRFPGSLLNSTREEAAMDRDTAMNLIRIMMAGR